MTRKKPRTPPPGRPAPRSQGRRQRGGQPGNHNALKHGFYSGLIRPRERQLLDQLPAADLAAEIELIHITTARFLEALQASKGTLDYEANLTALRLVNLSAQSIAALLRVQAFTASASLEAAEVFQSLERLASREPAPPSPAPGPAPGASIPHRDAS
jgi:hypothetical protein